MYRDFVARRSATGAQPEMSLERAIDDQRLMDQIYAQPDRAGLSTRHEHFDIVIIGTGAGGGTMAHALADDRRAHPDPRARRLRAAGRGELESGGGLEAPALPDDRALARRARPRVPAVHALLRRRQHEVLGQRALPAAARGLPGASSTSTASRRRGRSTTTRSRRTTIAPSGSTTCTAQHGVDPTEPPRGPYPYAPVPHAPAMAAIVEQLRAQGLHPSPLPLGLIRPGEADGCVLCNTCNSFPCKLHAKSDADVCCVRPALQQPNVDAVDQRAARGGCITDPARRAGRGRRGRARTARRVRVDAPLVVVSCGAVNSAALLLRSANDAHPDGLANSSGLVGRRYMAHLATMMQGFHPFRLNDDRVPEDGGDQRLLPARARTRRIRSARSSRRAGRTASWRRPSCPWIPLWAYDAWVARGVDWLAMSEDLPRADNRVTVDARRPHPPALPPEQPRARIAQLVAETKRILRRLGFWMVMTHSHGSRNTTHQCGTLVFGTDPRDVGARSVLPHARRREPVRRRRVVLPVVGGRQPGADDRRAGAAGRRSHPGDGAQATESRA